MYATERLQPGQWLITLPAHSPLSPPLGTSRNVYLLAEDTPTLVDTGFSAQREALVAALDELGFRPADIQRVALTSRDSAAAGNADLFENASLWAPAAPSAQSTQWLAHLESVLQAMKGQESVPEAWQDCDVQTVIDALKPPQLPAHTLPLEEGMPLRLDRQVFDVLLTPGCGEGGAAFYAPAERVLYAGPCATWQSRPVVRAYSDFAESVGRVSRLSLEQLRPVHGPIEAHPEIFFRSLSLFVTNLRSNMQYVLSKPVSAFELAFSDFGYLPDDLLEFAGAVLEFDAILREFAAAGVVTREGQGPLPRWAIGAPVSRT